MTDHTGDVLQDAKDEYDRLKAETADLESSVTGQQAEIADWEGRISDL